jgi:hypothetical protein
VRGGLRCRHPCPDPLAAQPLLSSGARGDISRRAGLPRTRPPASGQGAGAAADAARGAAAPHLRALRRQLAVDDADVGGSLLQQVPAFQHACDAIACGEVQPAWNGHVPGPQEPRGVAPMQSGTSCCWHPAPRRPAPPALSLPRDQRSRRNFLPLPSSCSASVRMRSCRSSTYASKPANAAASAPAIDAAACCAAADALTTRTPTVGRTGAARGALKLAGLWRCARAMGPLWGGPRDGSRVQDPQRSERKSVVLILRA